MHSTYHIRVREQLTAHWSPWFDDLTITADADGATILHGELPDQAALFGVLARIRDIGLTLLSVTCHDDNVLAASGTETEIGP